MEILEVKIAFVQINWNSIIECKKLEGFLFHLMTFQEIYMKFYEVNKLKIQQQHLDKKIHEKIELDFHVEIFVLLSFTHFSPKFCGVSWKFLGKEFFVSFIRYDEHEISSRIVFAFLWQREIIGSSTIKYQIISSSCSLLISSTTFFCEFQFIKHSRNRR